MDITNLCRSCMKEVASWEKDNFNTNTVEMFCFCTNITVLDYDKLPRQFCYDCLIKIESSYTFIKDSLKTDITLKNIISRTDTSIIIEPESHIKSNSDIADSSNDFKRNCEINNTDNLLNESVVNFEKDTNCNETLEDIPTESCSETFIKEECVKETKNDDKCVCPVCHKKFTSKTWFSKHMEKEHTGNKYTCTQCDKTFSKRSQLSSHMSSHSDRIYSCSICPKRFKRQEQLTAHTKAHSDARPFACTICNMRFKLKSSLKSHMKLHEGDKQHLCYFCGWSFAQSGNLKVHMRTHTGAKPFRCSQCAFRASCASSVRRHERIHRSARDYACAHCSKRFYDASGLTRHVRTHTGELPYACPCCARRFVDSWKRKTHLMRAHRHRLGDIPRMRRDGTALHDTDDHAQ